MRRTLKAALVGAGAVIAAAVLAPAMQGTSAVPGIANAEAEADAVGEPADEQVEPLAFTRNSAQAAHTKPKYTYSSTLITGGCPIYLNIPHGSPNPSAPHWDKPVKDGQGHDLHVGVRYTLGGSNGYALVRDLALGDNVNPHWGFIEKRCLNAKHARGQNGEILDDLRAVGGDGKVEDVTLEADHTGKQRRKEIHLDSTATFRNRPQAFVIGNLDKGDTFVLPTSSCGHHRTDAWILGYSPRTERWGYVQAKHLPACTS
jgi:hypothetical protein